ncbi:MAG TPA: hypothetical protein DD435_10445 [Cyanobacteria bacterium UBA8530]|nr:hypothetical protein [Cyanobacteria bacterium UBA8530]
MRRIAKFEASGARSERLILRARFLAYFDKGAPDGALFFCEPQQYHLVDMFFFSIFLLETGELWY